MVDLYHTPSISDVDHPVDDRQVIQHYKVVFTSKRDHWLIVAMIRSSGARFDTRQGEWRISLTPDQEPLFFPGRIGEALAAGDVSLEAIEPLPENGRRAARRHIDPKAAFAMQEAVAGGSQ